MVIDAARAAHRPPGPPGLVDHYRRFLERPEQYLRHLTSLQEND